MARQDAPGGGTDDGNLLLTARGIGKTYPSGQGRVVAVAGVDLDIAPGEFVGITGPSGSGKSTLLYLLGTLERPDSGELRVAGRDVGRLSPKDLADLRRRSVGFVFQQFHLLPTLTALENVMVPLLPYARRGTLEERARSLLREVGLEDRLHHLPGQLSGGEQQRVAIARSLVGQPALILADEPTGNLDSATGEQVVTLLLDVVKRHQTTLIVATHDAELAGMAARRLRMRDGRVVA
jgi:putative ABC transport system ATP-binding protein